MNNVWVFFMGVHVLDPMRSMCNSFSSHKYILGTRPLHSLLMHTVHRVQVGLTLPLPSGGHMSQINQSESFL